MRPYSEYAAICEGSLESTLSSCGTIPEKLLSPMLYSLTSGGKRLRGVLLISSCEACGGNIQDAVPFACAIEMIHTYSLIHDDLPAMDNDELRRGKPTCHRAFGEDIAILAGDGLLSAACEVMAKAAEGMDNLRGIRALRVMMHHAGVCGMVAGQTADVAYSNEETDIDKVQYIHAHKTGDLLTAPVEAGLILGGAQENIVDAGREYGKNLGIAFQIVDDILDVCGDEKTLGKNVHKDADESKQTWVRAVGMGKARKDAEKYTKIACEACKCFDKDGFFRSVAEDMLVRIK